MRKLSILLALVAGLFTFPAHADFTGKDASAATVTFKNPGTCTAVVCVPVAQLYDGTNVVTLTTAGADAVSNSLVGVPVYARNLVYNGTTWDRWQGAVTVTGVATAANQTTSIGILNGVAQTTAHGCSVAGYGVLGCLGQIDDDVKGAIAPGTAIIGKVGIDQTTPGTTNLVQSSQDPCTFATKTTVAFTTTSAGPVSIVALSGSTKVYVCSISAITDTAIKLNFIDGTGGSCASAQHAIWGSTTAANGMSLAANGGFTQGSGAGTVGVTTAASALCLLQSGTSLVAGNVTYVQQ